VIKEDKFLISRRPYAVKLGTYRVESWGDGLGGPWYDGRIEAVWYRRRAGVTVACAGHLSHGMGRDGTTDPVRFLEGYEDGRYGGTCMARWDGERLWTDPSLPYVNPYLDLLRPMLDGFPEIPAGYDGWWTFHMEGRKGR
jgi:hypothetical protein